MVVELLLLGTVLLLLVYAVIADRRPAAMPPGPVDWVFVGQRPILTGDEARQLHKKHGPIVTQRLGGVRTVLVQHYTDVKDLLSRTELVDRPTFFRRFNLDASQKLGVLFNNGPHWSHGRRFILRQLRDLGSGAGYLEGAIHSEAEALVQHLRSYEGRPTLFPACFETAVLNVLWQLIAGRRYDLEAEEVCSIFKLIEDVKQNCGSTVLLELFPLLGRLPQAIQRRLLDQRPLHDFLQHMTRLIVRQVEEHEQTLDLDNPRDLIDEYLKEMTEQKQQDPSLRLSKEGLNQILFDLFNTGSDTLAAMLCWVVHYMALYPEVAQRCQREIDSVVPLETMVSLQHKQHLPFVEAFTSEALRHASMALFIPQRCVTQDTCIQGYTLPRGTAVTTCALLIHRDPLYWRDPDLFSPDRFLDSSGNYRSQREGFLPFGIGRRQCAGETLARTEFFLFTAAILQQFSVSPPKGVAVVDQPRETYGIRTPANQPLVYTQRQKMGT